MNIYADSGFVINDSSSAEAGNRVTGTYYVPNFTIQPYYAMTNTAANTWCRAPGITEAQSSMENILEHIADYLKIEPHIVKTKNLVNSENPAFESISSEEVMRKKVVPHILKVSDYEKRRTEIENFNKVNCQFKILLLILKL